MKNIFIKNTLPLLCLIAVVYLVLSSEAVRSQEVFPNSEFAADIETMQEAHYATYGEYRQIVDAAELVSETFPEGAYVNVYETPSGEKGYQIIYEDSENRYGIGYGPDAKAMTWVQEKAVGTTTSEQ